MRYTGPRGEVIEGRDDMVLAYIALVKKSDEEKEKWITELRSWGVAAAHPDDGWVQKYMVLAYPYFNDGVEVGSLVAIGNPKQYRVVRVTEVIVPWHLEKRYLHVPVQLF